MEHDELAIARGGQKATETCPDTADGLDAELLGDRSQGYCLDHCLDLPAAARLFDTGLVFESQVQGGQTGGV
jgi:hypothetical protein